jgi:hypothetical protein
MVKPKLTKVNVDWTQPKTKLHAFRVHVETKDLTNHMTSSQLEDLNDLLERTIWGIVPQLQQHQVAVNINYQHIEQHQQATHTTEALITDLYAFFNSHPLPVYSEILKELKKEVLKRYETK